MNRPRPVQVVMVAGVVLVLLAGCNQSNQASIPAAPGVPTPSSQWLGLPSAINQVIVFLHDGTGWLLNKSQVTIKKVGEVQVLDAKKSEYMADFEIKVEFGNETFETKAKDVPCDEVGIPTDASVDRLRSAVEEIKVKMQRLQE